MSKIYTVNDGESESNQIPSIGYIHELVKIIEDELIHQDLGFMGFPTIKTDVEELPVGVKENPTILANEIQTDSDHQFVSSAILDTMVDKPTNFKVNESIEKVKSDLKLYMDKTYMRIINTPNVINKLRDISTILSEDKIADGLLSTLANKLNIDDYDEHKASSIHINNNDRKALNILIKCLTEGFSNWDAKEGEYNAIKNKPESLPANGGNADTIGNHGLKDLINKDNYDIVIGCSGFNYSKDSCDIYAENGAIDSGVLSSSIASLKDGGIILFKRGDYVVESIDNNQELLIFKGVDYRLSSVTIEKGISISNSVFKDISLLGSTIYINSNCDISNVCFTYCKVVFNSSIMCNITNCIFDNCEFGYTGSLMSNIIKFNRYINTKPITYIGGKNIITENI